MYLGSSVAHPIGAAPLVATLFCLAIHIGDAPPRVDARDRQANSSFLLQLIDERGVFSEAQVNPTELTRHRRGN